MLTRDGGYAQLSDEQIASYATKAQREWHWSHYQEAEQRVILARIARLVEANPRSYLAKHWREVYK
jgi:hypothetical protein